MSVRVLAGFLGGVACLLLASQSQAACSKDNDCPGEQVCDGGACVAPPPAASPSPPPPVAAPLATAPPVAPPVPVARSIAAEPTGAPPIEVTPRPRPRGKRHSTGMMVGGIIITGLAVIPLNIAVIGSLMCSQGESNPADPCDGSSYVTGGLIAASVLLAVGIPLVVIGSKREGAASARFIPWATPQSAGLGLQLEL